MKDKKKKILDARTDEEEKENILTEKLQPSSRVRLNHPSRIVGELTTPIITRKEIQSLVSIISSSYFHDQT